MADLKKDSQDIQAEDVAAVDNTVNAEAKPKGKPAKTEKVADLKVDTKGHFDGLAEQSAKNRQTGGENVKIDLAEKVAVRFTKDIGFIKKGHEQIVSQTAYNIYKDKGAVEKI